MSDTASSMDLNAPLPADWKEKLAAALEEFKKSGDWKTLKKEPLEETFINKFPEEPLLKKWPRENFEKNFIFDNHDHDRLYDRATYEKGAKLIEDFKKDYDFEIIFLSPEQRIQCQLKRGTSLAEAFHAGTEKPTRPMKPLRFGPARGASMS